VVLGRRHAEVQLLGHAQRPGNLLPRHLRDRLAGGAANDPPDDVAEGVGVVSSGMPGTPAEWSSTCRTVTACLPWAPNSGHSPTIDVS
jgi:hypothetical protein